jgi:hypothetical protein
MNTTYKVSKIGEPTAKGNCTISVSVTKGFATQPTPYFILSNPEAVESAGINVGDDVTDVLSGFKVQQSELTDEETGEITTFNWLVPPIE